VRDTLAPELNNSELSLFALVADRSGLDPFAKQIYAIKRAGRVTFQTGIDGYRSIAARTGQYEGSSDAEFGEWTDAPFPHPVSCTVIVYRWQNGRRIEQAGTAWWDEYYPGEKGKVPSGPRDTGYMWLTKPRVMISKVAEAIALRKAFPYLLADLYVREEMEAAGPPENTPLVTAAAQPTARERMAARRAALEAAPVQDAPHDIEEAEVVSESTDEPETAPDPGACPVRSPYEDGAACVLPVGHKGNHKSEGRETWA
jgi:phage recombination protein Bet